MATSKARQLPSHVLVDYLGTLNLGLIEQLVTNTSQAMHMHMVQGHLPQLKPYANT